MKLECPYLDCAEDTTLSETECFQHDAKASSLTIRGRLCFDASKAKSADPRLVCPFNVHDYMWVNETLQGQELNTSAMIYTDASQVMQRKRVARCMDAAGVNQDLNPGRTCTFSSQCKSGFCKDNVCQGYEVDKGCHSHDDCIQGTYCRNLNYWPFMSVCAPHKKDREICEEDF